MAVVVVFHGQDKLVVVPSVSTSLGHMNGSRICRTHLIITSLILATTTWLAIWVCSLQLWWLLSKEKRLSSLVHLSTFLLLEALLYWLKKYMKTIRVGHYNFLKIMVIGQNVQFLAFIQMMNLIHPFMMNTRMKDCAVIWMKEWGLVQLNISLDDRSLDRQKKSEV